MAATWDIVLISPCFWDMRIEYEKKIGIGMIWSIDDWSWKNQREVQAISDVERMLDEGKIIVISFETNYWKDMGMYIEKEGEYIYTLWFNTEGVPELDSDTVNEGNIKYYEKACRILKELITAYSIDFRAIAIGVESDVQYCGDIEKMMKDSYNVVVWILNKNGRIEIIFEKESDEIQKEVKKLWYLWGQNEYEENSR